MSIEDKKFSLDELPDEGSAPAPIKPEPKKASRKKEEPDPRIANLNKLDPVTRVEVMVQKWEFDQPIKNYTWVAYIVALVVLQFMPIYQKYMSEIHAMSKTSRAIGDLWIENAGIIETILKNPILLIILAPFVYRSPKSSDYIFRISFDGIDTVKKFLPDGSKEIVSRTLIKWKDIDRVEKGTTDNKEILRLYSVEGHIGDIIWYIDETKKKAIKLLLKGMVVPKHPLRVFLDNQKDLK